MDRQNDRWISGQINYCVLVSGWNLVGKISDDSYYIICVFLWDVIVVINFVVYVNF